MKNQDNKTKKILEISKMHQKTTTEAIIAASNKID